MTGMSRLIVGLTTFDADNGQPKSLELHLPDERVITLAISEIRQNRVSLAITAPDDVRVERKN